MMVTNSDFQRFMSKYLQYDGSFILETFPAAWERPFSIRDRAVLYCSWLLAAGRSNRDQSFIPSYDELANYIHKVQSSDPGRSGDLQESSIKDKIEDCVKDLKILPHVARSAQYQVGVLPDHTVKRRKYKHRWKSDSRPVKTTLWTIAYPSSLIYETMRVLDKKGPDQASIFIREVERFSRMLSKFSKGVLDESSKEHDALTALFDKLHGIIRESPRYKSPIGPAIRQPWRSEADFTVTGLSPSRLTRLLEPDAPIFKLSGYSDSSLANPVRAKKVIEPVIKRLKKPLPSHLKNLQVVESFAYPKDRYSMFLSMLGLIVESCVRPVIVDSNEYRIEEELVYLLPRHLMKALDKHSIDYDFVNSPSDWSRVIKGPVEGVLDSILPEYELKRTYYGSKIRISYNLLKRWMKAVLSDNPPEFIKNKSYGIINLLLLFKICHALSLLVPVTVAKKDLSMTLQTPVTFTLWNRLLEMVDKTPIDH